MAFPALYMEQLTILAVAFLIPPILGLVLLIIALASIGKSLGIRKAYAGLLLKTFEWASRRIEKAAKEQKHRAEVLSRDSSENDDEIPSLPRSPSTKNFIQKDATIRITRSLSVAEPENDQRFGYVADSLDFIKAGMESIIDDEVTSRFSAEELTSWNLLSRTSLGYQYVSLRLTILWCLGFILRYCVLFPIRMIILFIGLTFLIVSTAFVGYVPDGKLKRTLNRRVSLICYRILCRAVTAIITYHNGENMAKPGGICVANHTSPIDVMILSCDNCYALVGQKHGGLLGLIQRALNRASSHIWFERAEVNDRVAVSRRLSDHVRDMNKLPILIFPEGTCINNTSVMMFKKGSFEVGGVIYPAAIKYDARFGDAFWNSSKQSYVQYLVMMMTSWAIVVDVHYLPPMTRQEGENSIDFAARVKKEIAAAGGLVDLEWDGQLKRYPVKKEMLEKQQERYSRRIKNSAVCLPQLDANEDGDGDSVSQSAFTAESPTVDGTESSSSDRIATFTIHPHDQNGTGLIKRQKPEITNGQESMRDEE